MPLGDDLWGDKPSPQPNPVRKSRVLFWLRIFVGAIVAVYIVFVSVRAHESCPPGTRAYWMWLGGGYECLRD